MTLYEEQNYRMYRDNDGERDLLANFIATIDEEVRYVDGASTETFLVISAIGPPDKPKDPPYQYPPTKIPAASFPGMQWVMQAWGVRAVIQPGSSIKDDLRTAIQLRSKPKVTTIYRHIGWQDINGQKSYLHSTGAITAKGNNKDVQVQLPMELKNFALDLGDKKATKEAIRASIALTQIGPREVTWPMLAGTYAPLYGPVDFAMHLTGRTGTFKSELTSLFQSHFGAKMDSRHLPGSWSSTPNALEAQAYYAKNAVFAIDDFIPSGTSWQIRAYQTNADKIMRSQGNQSGRARLTDTSSLQTAMYPRGIVFSTGEDTPEGHSVRARMMIMEIKPGDITPSELTKAQNNREKYPLAVGAFAQYLCTNELDIRETAKQIRDANLSIGHTRTPSMLGTLVASISYFLEWAAKMGAITKEEKNAHMKEAMQSISKTARDQTTYLESSDPCDLFTAALRQALTTGLGHLRTLNGGIPKNCTQLGWTVQDEEAEIPMYRSLGPCIGWINWNEGEIYLEVNSGYNVVKKVAGQEVSLTKQTLMKRLRDAGTLTRTDEARQRNTVRVNAEKHPRQVLSLSIPVVLESQELPNEQEQATDQGDAYEGD